MFKKLILTFSLGLAITAAAVENGTYECTFPTDEGGDYTFIFDLTDQFIKVYDDDGVTIESILVYDQTNPTWEKADEEKDDDYVVNSEYRITRPNNGLVIEFKTVEKNNVSGVVEYTSNITIKMSKTTDSKYILINEEQFTELDQATGLFDTVNNTSKAICIIK